MTKDMTLSIQGTQEAQKKNLTRIAMLQPGGLVQRELQDATISAHRYAVTITHVGRYRSNGAWAGGGSLRASHRIQMQNLKGIVYIDPSARNPRSKVRPAEYGVYENARGGEHAFYDRTMNEAIPGITARATENILKAYANVE
jgi:hypothetical protein